MKFLITLLLAVCVNLGVAQNGYQIQVSIPDDTAEVLYLTYYLGDQQYIQDTVQRAADGTFTFRGERALATGVYAIVEASTMNSLRFLLTEDEQRFSLQTKMGDGQLAATRFQGSAENERYYGYLRQLSEFRTRGDALRAQLEAANATQRVDLQAQLDQLNQESIRYQEQLIVDHPSSLTTAIVKANLPLNPPAFSGTAAEQDAKRQRWIQQHFFDHMDLTDGRLLRTPFLFDQVDNYVHQLRVQHPDTVSQAIDYVLQQMRPNAALFQYYLIHFYNYYGASKEAGMDAVFVDLIDNYYAQGLAPWTDAEQLQQMQNNADRLRPLLIGEIAPNITMQRRDSSAIGLHDVQTPYTVLYFWRYDCPKCKKSTPAMEAFQEAFKDQGVTLFAVCTKLRDDVPACWDYVDDNGIGDWLHVVDPSGRSRFMLTYNLRTTPQIYVLDADHRIIAKGLGADQLPEVMNRALAADNHGSPQATPESSQHK